jgi:hypothetical protein
MLSLGQGRIVKLGRLGSFQVGVSSEGLPSAEEVTSHAIIKSRINFRPSKRLRSFLKDIVFKKISWLLPYIYSFLRHISSLFFYSALFLFTF